MAKATKPFVRNSIPAERNLFEVIQICQALDSFIGDLCADDVQLLEAGKTANVLHTSVGELRLVQNQIVEGVVILEAGQHFIRDASP
jgi:hypothetical protein